MNILWYNNLLFSKCENHDTIITPNHINNLHDIINPPNLSTILYEEFMKSVLEISIVAYIIKRKLTNDILKLMIYSKSMILIVVEFSVIFF